MKSGLFKKIIKPIIREFYKYNLPAFKHIDEFTRPKRKQNKVIVIILGLRICPKIQQTKKND